MAESSMTYSSQLREMFDTFDTKGEGSLGREALEDMCRGLELEEYTNLLLEKVLGNNLTGKVKFSAFKEALISILQDVDSPIKSAKNMDPSVEVTPKYVMGGKTYGRRSKPVIFEDDELDPLDAEVKVLDISAAGNNTPQKAGRVISPPSEAEENKFHIKRRRKDAPRTVDIQDETFEAEGQLNLTMTDREGDVGREREMENGRDRLLDVWRTLGVGQDGYLTLAELRTVCNYIGMEMEDNDFAKLFKKLDKDHDGKVSFEELLNSFTHSNSRPLTPSPRPSKSVRHAQQSVGTPVMRTLSAQRKLKITSTPSERNVPAIVLSSGEVTGLFSSLDVYQSGFAQSEDIIDLWEKHNIMNGSDILNALGFDQDTKLNLSELSFALEQTLANENLDAVSHAALVTCQHELRHLRCSVDALTSERNKLRLDLQEANARSALLAKEVDERHADLEKTNETKLLTIEKKYQDQIRSLQGALESERETHSTHTAKLCENLETEMEELRGQECRLKDNLYMAQAEVERLQSECSRARDNLEEASRHNSRLLLEVDDLDHLRRKVAEYEQNQDVAEETHNLNKIHWLEAKNKEMKDKIDELTAEMESLTQQLASCRRKLRGSSSSSQTKIPIREGATLSDFSRPRRKSSLASMSSIEATDQDEVDAAHKSRRAPKLTSRRGRASGDDDSSGEHSLSNSQKLELLERDQQQIQHNFRLEVSQLEDTHQTEKENILRNFDIEKTKLREEWERSLQQRLAEQQVQLQNDFTQEKNDLLQKYESKKNHLEHTQKEEKDQLLKRLKEEYEKDIDSRLGKLKEDFGRERSRLEESRSIDRDSLRDLEKMCADLETRLKSERKEAEQLREKDFKKFEEEKENLKKAHNKEKEFLKHRLESEHRQDVHKELLGKQDVDSSVERMERDWCQKRDQMEARHRQEMQELEDGYQLQLFQLESMLEQGVAGLRGKLREDFDALLHTATEECIAAEKALLYSELDKHRREVETEREVTLRNFENRHSQILHELVQKQQNLDAENRELQQKKVDFDEECMKIMAEMEKVEKDYERDQENMIKKKEEFEEVKKQIEDNLEEERNEIGERLQSLRVREEEVEEERARILEELEEKELNLATERNVFEEQRFEFEQMKSDCELNLSRKEEDISSDLRKRMSTLEAEEKLLEGRKQDVLSEKQKHVEFVKAKETELSQQEKDLEKKISDFDKERQASLDELEKEKAQRKSGHSELLVRQRDIEKEYSTKLEELDKVKERLKEDEKNLTARQTELELEHASIKEQLQKEREELSASKDELDRRKLNTEQEHTEAVEKAETEKREMEGKLEKMKEKLGEVVAEHEKVVEQLEEISKEKKSLEEVIKSHESQMEELERTFEKEKDKLCESYEEEKTLLMEKYQDEILELQGLLREKHREMEEKDLERERSLQEQQQREEDLIQTIREDLQSSHVRQVTELQEAFDSEKSALQKQSQSFEQQISDLQHDLEAEQELSRHEKEEKQLTLETLQSQLKQAEDIRDSLEEQLSEAQEESSASRRRLEAQIEELLEAQQDSSATRHRLETRIEELLAEKDAEITAVRTEVLQATQQSFDEEKGKVEEELKLVSLKTSALEDKLSIIQKERDALLEYKDKYHECYEEKVVCEEDIQKLRKTVTVLEEEVKSLSKMKDLYDESVAERERLGQQLRQALDAANISPKKDASQDEISNLVLEKERDILQQQVNDLKGQVNNKPDNSVEVEKLKADMLNLSREKAELQDKLNSLKDQIQDTRTSKRRDDKEQARAAQDEKKVMEQKLQRVSDKLLKASTELSVAQSHHLQEISRWKDSTKNMVDLEQFTNLQLSLIKQQRSMNELQAALQEKLELIEDLKEGHKRLVKQLEGEKKEMTSKLEQTHNLFKEEAQKVIKTYETLAEKNKLVKNLYEENCQLTKKVKATEKRCLHVERKCASLQQVINQACKDIKNNFP